MKTLCIAAIIAGFCVTSHAKEIYVSPSGDDTAPGTFALPIKTLEMALKHQEKIAGKEPLDIILRQGTYSLTSPLVFGVTHSGTQETPIVWKNYPGETVRISGGVELSNWSVHKTFPNQWNTETHTIVKTPLKRPTRLRALYMNGARAQTPEAKAIPIRPWGSFSFSTNDAWSVYNGSEPAGVCFRTNDLPMLSNPTDVELFQSNEWCEKIVGMESMEITNDVVRIKFQQPYGALATSQKWGGFKLNPIAKVKPFFIRNAFELMKNPGEFYFNRSEQTLYYFLKPEERVESLSAIAPLSQGLIHIEGDDLDHPVEYLTFQGIHFSHDDYLLENVGDSFGFVGVQSLAMAQYLHVDGNWHLEEYNVSDIPQGTIEVKNARHIHFIRNKFHQLGSAVTINLVNDVTDATVTGNCFNDLLGNAVNIGHPQHYKIDEGVRYKGKEGVCKNIEIKNNFIQNVSKGFRQVEGISAFFVQDITIAHNDISFIPYGGIALGWWWGDSKIPHSTVPKNNSITHNRVGPTHVNGLNDGGGIYVLGKQPNSVIAHNFIYHAPRSIYPDDGAAYWEIHHNVIDSNNNWLNIWSPRIHDLNIHDNFTSSRVMKNNGVNTRCTPINTQVSPRAIWTKEALDIIQKSGIEPEYQDILPKGAKPFKATYDTEIKFNTIHQP